MDFNDYRVLPSKRAFIIILFVLLTINLLSIGSSVAQNKWIQSYNSGYIDKKGNFAGGSEIMHLVSHKGKI